MTYSGTAVWPPSRGKENEDDMTCCCAMANDETRRNLGKDVMI